MVQEPEILYKLMVLYMLSEVSFPLTNSQLSDFFLEKEYTTYFTLQRVLNDLCGTGFIEKRPVGTQTHYELTDDGAATLRFFTRELSDEIKADIDAYLKENRFRMRSEVCLAADYYQSESRDYVVQLRILEGRGEILSVDVTLPDEDAAKSVAANWKANAQKVYSYLMETLI